MSKIIIKEAQLDDYHTVVDLRKQLSQESTYLPYSSMDQLNDQKILRKSKKIGHSYNLLIKDGLTIGYMLFQKYTDVAACFSLGVLKDFHNHGYGKTLIDNALDMAKQRGFELVFLHVNTANQKALELYHRYGFTIVEEVDLGDDLDVCYKMALEI